MSFMLRSLQFVVIVCYFYNADAAVGVRLGHRLINNYKVVLETPVENVHPLKHNVRQLNAEKVEKQTEAPLKVEEEEEEDIDYEDLEGSDIFELLISEYEEDNGEDQEEEISNTNEQAAENSNVDEEELLELLQSLGLQLDAQSGRATIPLRKLRRRLSRIPRRLFRRFIKEFL